MRSMEVIDFFGFDLPTRCMQALFTLLPYCTQNENENDRDNQRG